MLFTLKLIIISKCQKEDLQVITMQEYILK